MSFDIGGAFAAGANAYSADLTGQRLRQQDEEARARQASRDALAASLHQAEINHYNAETQRALRPPEPRNIDPNSPEGIAAGVSKWQRTEGTVPHPHNIDPNSPEGIKARIAAFRAQRDYEVAHPLRDPNAAAENFDPLNPKDRARFIAGEIRRNMAPRPGPSTIDESGNIVPGPLVAGMAPEDATKRARAAWDAYVASVGPTAPMAPVAPVPPFMSTVGTMMGGAGQPPAPKKPFQARLTELQQSGVPKEQARQTLTDEGYLDPQGRIVGPQAPPPSPAPAPPRPFPPLPFVPAPELPGP